MRQYHHSISIWHGRRLFQILQISEDNIRIKGIAKRSCFNNQSGKVNSPFLFYNKSHPFSYSYTLNNFIAIWCDIFAYITRPDNESYRTGCASLWNNVNDMLIFPLPVAPESVAAGLYSKQISHPFISGSAASTCFHQPRLLSHVALLS